MSDDILAETRSLTVDFLNGPDFLRALDGVDLTIHKGEFVSLVGVSGSGKTTLLNAIGGLIVPTSGSIIFNSIRFDSMSEEERTIFRRNHIGFIFQNFNLIPSLNIFQNICFSAQLSQKPITAQQVEKIAQQLGIEDKLSRMPAELSGGQQQRAAIARAMLARPSLLLADEPTGSLDSLNGRSIMQLLRKAVSENNMSVLMATHNEEFASQTDRMIHIEDGKIIAEESRK
ncbi:MAG: ABC transporter ATP-binding protein [Bilifractor sp.]|jgi:putative ABC transport system ATP-binding protein